MNNASFREIGVPGNVTNGFAAAPLRLRLPQFLGVQRDLASLFPTWNIAVVGAGSIGRSLASHAARLQVGALTIVDRSHYKAESVLTQAVTPADIGAPKASNTGQYCKRVSPNTRVFAFDGPLESLPVAAFAGANLVFAATDNLLAEIEIGQRCLNLGIPLIHAAVFGPTLVAQIRFFANNDAAGPCPTCGFNSTEWHHVNRETIFSCQGYGTHDQQAAAAPATGPDTQSLSFLSELAADLALMQALRHVAALGEPMGDTLLEYCGYTHRTIITPLRRRADCPCDHQEWVEMLPPQPLTDCTPRELLVATPDEQHDLRGISFDVDASPFVETGLCSSCGRRHAIKRFVTPLGGALSCTACGSPIDAEPLFTHRPVAADLLRGVLDRPLRDIVSAAPQTVIVRGRERAVMFREHRSDEDGV